MILRRHISPQVQFEGVYAFGLSSLLRSVVTLMTGFFVPLYLFQLGESLFANARLALLMTFGFYLGVRILVFLLSVPITKVIERVGFRWSMLLSTAAFTGYYVALIRSVEDWRFLPLAAAFLAASLPLFWITRHAVVSPNYLSKDISRRVGILADVEQAVAMLGPLVGSLIIGAGGFVVLYLFALFLLAVSILPLMFVPHHVVRSAVSWRGFGIWIRDRGFFHQGVGVASQGMEHQTYTTIWPLAILLIGITIPDIGWVLSGVMALAIVVRFVGRALFERLHSMEGYEDEWLFAVTAAGSSLFWLWRVFVRTLSGLLLVEGFATIFRGVYHTIAEDYLLLGSRRMSEVAYFTYAEMVRAIGGAVILVVALVAVQWEAWREAALVVTSFWIILSIVQGRESNLKG